MTMNVTKSMIQELKDQIKTGGSHIRKETYVFQGKREQLILSRNIILVVDASGEYSPIAQRRIKQILSKFETVEKYDNHFYEIIHAILRTNGQKGLNENHNTRIARLNEVLDSNNYGF